MDSPRILKTRNSNITYQVVKKNRSSPSTSIRSKRNNSKSKSKPKPLENIDATNKIAHNSPLSSPASSLEGLSVSDSESEDSDEELVETPSKSQSNSNFNSLDFYKDNMKNLARTYKDIIDRSSFPGAQQTNLHPSRCNPSSSSTCSTKRDNRRSQEDINNANLLLLLRMVE